MQLKTKALEPELREIRQHLHQHPETAYEEYQTSAFVKSQLESFGIKVYEGLASTGLVGILQHGNSTQSIALRADMDALDLCELNTFSHSSKTEGKMHGCGHDGHTTMLLGAAKYLAQTKAFNGTVYFFFQPAEENNCGAKKMIEEGLFKKFPAKRVYGLHNWPDLDFGKIAIKEGPIMASSDYFDITITAKGAHAAMPHKGINPLLVASSLVQQLNLISTQNIDPLESCVLTVTQIHGGDALNVIPNSASVKGTVRAFSKEVQKRIDERIKQICKGLAQSFEVTIDAKYHYSYTPTINTFTQTALQAATHCVGKENVVQNFNPSMGAEDFGYMLEEAQGCYVWIGAKKSKDNFPLHSPYYDFNDNILSIGSSYFVHLVETELKELV